MAKIAVYMSGGIAIYKGIEVVRQLQKQGHEVRVAMTESATKLVSPVTLHALTHQPILTSLWSKEGEPVPHIELADWSGLALVVPATANIIAKMANGIADDAVSTALLATAAPKVVVPAMNTNMWNNPAVQRNIQQIQADGTKIIFPETGMLAEGYSGKGRLPEPAAIFDQLKHLMSPATDSTLLKGKRVLITAGGTREPIDPVRFIGNRSSGKMGIALAKAAVDAGADVDLVVGQISVELPNDLRINISRVETSEELLKKTNELFAKADILIMAAAVADFRPAIVADKKIKKQADQDKTQLTLVKTTDILREMGQKKQPGQVIVGFAAETNDLLANANHKLASKNADMIVANGVGGANSAFASDQNEVTILRPDQEAVKLPRQSKTAVAQKLIQIIAKEMRWNN